MKVIGISGTLAGHKTSQMVYELIHAIKQENQQIDTELIDLKDYEIEFMRGFPLAYYNDDTQHVVKTIGKADCIIIGTPIYQASIPGSLKNLMDLLPEHAFRDKIVGYMSTAGSEKHFLVAEYQLRPIIQFLGGVVPSRNLFIPDSSFNEENEIVDDRIKWRIVQFAKELNKLLGGQS